MQQIEARIRMLSEQIGLECPVCVEYSQNMLDPAYICNKNGQITLYLNEEKLRGAGIPIEYILLHELFHARQIENGYPVAASAQPDRRVSDIFNSVMDCCVTADMCENGFTDAAYAVFAERIGALSECSAEAATEIGMLHRTAQFLAEAKLWFVAAHSDMWEMLKEKSETLLEDAEAYSRYYTDMIGRSDRCSAAAELLCVLLERAGYRVMQIGNYLIAEGENTL